VERPRRKTVANVQFDSSFSRATVSLKRKLEASSAVVWGDLTDRDRLRTWFPCDVIVEGGEWRVGATISFPFPKDIIDMTLKGEVLECEVETQLSYTWGEDVLTFELHEEKGSTILELRNELDAPSAARNAAGWEDCLDRLTGKAAATGAWKAHFEEYRARFEGTLGPQEGPPAGYREPNT
jgi:uncharacterized protein YndB with AHSA1/START domain